MKMLALLILCLPLAAQEHHKNWTISVSILTGAQAADVLSSRGMIENNPVLGAGRPFGARQEAIKGGVVVSAVIAEWLILCKRPTAARIFIPANYAAAGVTMGVAVHNWRLR